MQPEYERVSEKRIQRTYKDEIGKSIPCIQKQVAKEHQEIEMERMKVENRKTMVD